MLKQITPELWVVDAPLRYLGVEIGRRMTVVKLPTGELLVHSPAELDDGLRAALDRLGQVRFVVCASLLHGHLWMEEYRDAYPGAELFAAPGLTKRRKDLSFAGTLGATPDPRWSADLDQTVFHGNRFLTETEFFHRPSRTLIAGDLCFNTGDDAPFMTRLFARGPRMKKRLGPTPLFRAGIRDREAASASVERILEWDFDRIIPGHGETVETGGREKLRDDFGWLLNRRKRS